MWWVRLTAARTLFLEVCIIRCCCCCCVVSSPMRASVTARSTCAMAAVATAGLNGTIAIAQRALCDGGGERRTGTSTAVSWLVSSRDGHCGVTKESWGHQSCNTDTQGSWKLSELGKRASSSWPLAVAACLRRCTRCANCRHVSVSTAHNDCSWYAACETLHQSPPTFRSGSVALWHSKRCRTNLAPFARPRSPAEWLGSSVEGHCGVTDGNGHSQSCELDDAGTWGFQSLGLDVAAATEDAWSRAAEACSRRCAACTRCRNLSISLLNEECSWYASCAHLSLSPKGYRTASIASVEQGGASHPVQLRLGITPSTASSALDDWRRLLAAAPTSYAGAGSRSLVLLAVFSGSAARRAYIRCTWGAELSMRSGDSVRLRFVLGRSSDEPLGELHERPPDELVTPVREGMRVQRTDPHASRRRGRQVVHGTITKQLKMIHFLRWAMRQPEALVAMGDDDVFVSVQMLAATARLLDEQMRSSAEPLHLYLGRLEWYSWHDRTMVSSGWAQELREAMRLAQESWRNCSPNGRGWEWTGWAFREAAPSSAIRDTCHGPLAFAKGPLTILSRPAVEWVVASRAFARDANTSIAMAFGDWEADVEEHPNLVLEAGSRDMLEDVQLGFWLASNPNLRLVQLPRGSWADGFHQVGRLERLLVAHQVPWNQIPWLTEHSNRLWRKRGAQVRRSFVCSGAPCTHDHCAQSISQRACALRVELVQRNDSSASASCHRCSCVATMSHGRSSRSGGRSACKWRRAEEPEEPAGCGQL